jgi:hypothetical protein
VGASAGVAAAGQKLADDLAEVRARLAAIEKLLREVA